MKKLFILVLCLLVSSCGTSLRQMPTSTQLLTSYEIDQVQEATIGEPIVEMENASVRDAYEVIFDYDTPGRGILAIGKQHLPAGTRYTAAAVSPGDPQTVFVRPEGAPSQVLISIFRDGRVNKGWVLADGTIPVQGSWPEESLFRLSDVPSREQGSFKAQIIYSGLSGNTVRAMYREFADDYARPAFSQELLYDLDESSLISYRSLRIEIIEATNASIRYKVLDDGGLDWLPR